MPIQTKGQGRRGKRWEKRIILGQVKPEGTKVLRRVLELEKKEKRAGHKRGPRKETLKRAKGGR